MKFYIAVCSLFFKFFLNLKLAYCGIKSSKTSYFYFQPAFMAYFGDHV